MRLSAARADAPALERCALREGVVVYRGARLAACGFTHAFTTRHGGVSAPPFDTMNLGIAQAPGEPDTDANVAANAARLMAAIGAPHAHLVRVRQVHGAEVRVCESDDRFGAPTLQADAMVSRWPQVAPCIRTADCVPVLLGCTATGMAAAVHAGWRGIVAGVVGQAVARMIAMGAQADRVAAAIGPAIGCDAYEVGDEVAKAFEVAGLEAHVHRRAEWPRPHLDCAGAVRDQLQRAGVPADAVDGGNLCTVRDAGDFFSYRRDGARSGRMGAVIVPCER